jgi:ABC-type Zn uptake system ZnuABC Zn-binding protein ZnuA
MKTSCRSLRLDIITRPIALIAAIALVVVGCASATPTPPPDAIRVVATTTVLADMVRQVGGARVDVTSLVPPGGEVHTFDPTPADLIRVADARLIFMNGLGLDEWLGRIATDSGTSATIVEIAEDLDGVEYLEGGHDEHDEEEEDEHDEEEDEHEGEAVNPHLWLNVRYAMKYVERIAAALATADPDHAADYTAGADAYLARLAELDDWVRERIATIPQADRKIVSFHEAFPYFAAAYGLEIVGTVISAPGQDPSAGQIAALIEAIRSSGVKAIFSEAQFSPQLVETIARETGAVVESDLYNDSVGPPPADTYEGLIRWDVDRIVDALTR